MESIDDVDDALYEDGAPDEGAAQPSGRSTNPANRTGSGDADYRLPGLPRYVRINTLKISLKAANREMHNAGYHLCPDPRHPGKRSYHRDDIVLDCRVLRVAGRGS